MPKRVTQDWLSRAAAGLASGALALSLLATGGSTAPGSSVRPALAEELDCYNDKDVYYMAECAAQRELDRKTGNTPNDAQNPQGAQGSAPGAPTESSGAGQQQSGGGQQASGGGQQQSAGQQQAGGGQQQAAQGGDDEEDEEKPAPRGPVTDPHTVVLTLADAGKEATQFINEEGTDKYGKWARTRFERDRSNGASALGPNVMDSKVWVGKDVETAKTLFKEQAAIKNFPERTEKVQGLIEKLSPTKYGEEFAYVGGFLVDDKVWQHHRFAYRVGNIMAVVYLYGREDFFQDPEDKNWTGQGDWFTSAVFHRM